MAGATRRRGKELEEAILDAAWEELEESGYTGLTLEAVATRAKTSRPVLRRRWPSPEQLATAALARYVALNPVEVPDLGSVRDETRLLLRRISDRAPQGVLRFVLHMQEDVPEPRSDLAQLRDEIGERDLVQRILARGVARGEVDLDRVNPRVISLPIDLAILEELMTFTPISDEAIEDIVENVFWPLVRREG